MGGLNGLKLGDDLGFMTGIAIWVILFGLWLLVTIKKHKRGKGAAYPTV